MTSPSTKRQARQGEDLTRFEVVEMLSHSKQTKTVWFSARLKADPSQRAVLQFQKKDWDEQQLQELCCTGDLQVVLAEENNEYHQYSGVFSGDAQSLNSLKVAVTFPASDWHIEKYRAKSGVLMRETADMYLRCSKPLIDEFPPSRTQWVRDIVAGRKEQERVIHRDDLMCIVPDFKWDGADVNSMYYLAISCDASIRSVRDLNAAHLPMLESIKREAVRQLGQRFGVQERHLRFYVHYFPTFWHFHVHIVHVAFPVPGQGAFVGRALLLENIIDNIKLKHDYYQMATLGAPCREGDAFHRAFFQRIHRDLAEKYVRLSNEANLDAVYPMFSQHASYKSSATGEYQGIDQIKAMMAPFFAKYSNIHWEIIDGYNPLDPGQIQFKFVMTADGGVSRNGVETITFDSQGKIAEINVVADPVV